jgi:hypothetical protein
MACRFKQSMFGLQKRALAQYGSSYEVQGNEALRLAIRSLVEWRSMARHTKFRGMGHYGSPHEEPEKSEYGSPYEVQGNGAVWLATRRTREERIWLAIRSSAKRSEVWT